MSKVEWEKPILGKHTGTDGFGVVVSCRQQPTHRGEGEAAILHIDLLVFLDAPHVDPRPAIEAAIKTLRRELGME